MNFGKIYTNNNETVFEQFSSLITQNIDRDTSLKNFC